MPDLSTSTPTFRRTTRGAAAVALATGALCAATIALAGQAHADGENAPPAPQLEIPRCSAGDATDETGLLAALEKFGLRLESAHGHPGGGSELTYSGNGQWVRLLGDGGLACALAAGRDEETGA